MVESKLAEARALFDKAAAAASIEDQAMMNYLAGIMQLFEQVVAKVQWHLEQTNDHQMCWENDEELWKFVLGIAVSHPEPPAWPEFMTECARYRASRERDVVANIGKGASNEANRGGRR